MGIKKEPRPLVDRNGKPISADATASTTVAGSVKQAAAQADSVAADNTALRADFNALLAKLRTAGIMAP